MNLLRSCEVEFIYVGLGRCQVKWMRGFSVILLLLFYYILIYIYIYNICYIICFSTCLYTALLLCSSLLFGGLLFSLPYPSVWFLFFGHATGKQSKTRNFSLKLLAINSAYSRLF